MLELIRPTIKSFWIVEGYWGLMDRAQDNMTVIFDASLIWWPGRGEPNGLKTCLLLVWLTMLGALRIAMAEWDGPVLCKYSDVTSKCWKFF